MPRAPAVLLILLSCVFVSARIATGHDGVHAALARIDAQLARNDRDPELWLRRAELARSHGDLVRARADLDRAAELAPDHVELSFYRARLELDAGRPAAADRALRSYAAAGGSRPGAALLHGRALRALGRPGAAVAVYERALAASPRPNAELFLARAEAQLAAGRARAALAGLDEAVGMLGANPALLLRAVGIARQLEDWDGALARLEPLLAAAPRRDVWLEQRAELLVLAGRSAEARATCERGLREIAALPDRHRNVSVTRLREARLRAWLERLASDGPS